MTPVDPTDEEISEAMDADAELADEILHAPSEHRFCPSQLCNQPVLTLRDGISCIWCGTRTLPPTLLHPPVIRPGATRTRVSRRRGGAGTSGDTTEEAA